MQASDCFGCDMVTVYILPNSGVVDVILGYNADSISKSMSKRVVVPVFSRCQLRKEHVGIG